MRKHPLEKDLKVHTRNPKTGKIAAERPYRLVCVDQNKFFEIPAGSNKWVYENGETVPAELAPKLPAKKLKVPAAAQLDEANERIAELESRLAKEAQTKDDALELVDAMKKQKAKTEMSKKAKDTFAKGA